MVTRLYDFTNGTTADADEVDAELNQILNELNASVILTTGAQTKAGVLTFSDTPKTDAIAESTSGSGVTIDGILLKDDLDTSDILTKSTDQTLTGKKTMAAVVQTVTSYTPDAAATATLDLSLGNVHSITMPAGNITIAISNETAGQFFAVEITQDATGSRTVTWFTTIRWADGSAPTLTTTASKRDAFAFRVTGTDTYDGFVIGQAI